MDGVRKELYKLLNEYSYREISKILEKTKIALKK